MPPSGVDRKRKANDICTVTHLTVLFVKRVNEVLTIVTKVLNFVEREFLLRYRVLRRWIKADNNMSFCFEARKSVPNKCSLECQIALGITYSEHLHITYFEQIEQIDILIATALL